MRRCYGHAPAFRCSSEGYQRRKRRLVAGDTHLPLLKNPPLDPKSFLTFERRPRPGQSETAQPPGLPARRCRQNSPALQIGLAQYRRRPRRKRCARSRRGRAALCAPTLSGAPTGSKTRRERQIAMGDHTQASKSLSGATTEQALGCIDIPCLFQALRACFSTCILHTSTEGRDSLTLGKK